MSKQTPNLSTQLPLQDGVEPSMEDILASIRKIISDDAPVAMESPEDMVSPETAVALEADVPLAQIEEIAVQVEDVAVPTPSLSSEALPAATTAAPQGSILSTESAVDDQIEVTSSEVDMASLIQSVVVNDVDTAPNSAGDEILELAETDLLLADVAAMSVVKPDGMATSVEFVLGDTSEIEDGGAQIEVQGRDEILESVSVPAEDAATESVSTEVEPLQAVETSESASIEAMEIADNADDDMSELDRLLDDMPTEAVLDDTEAVLDDIEADLADIQSENDMLDDTPDMVTDSPADVELSSVETASVEAAQDEGDPDLELVKSLMADLADKPVVDEDVDAFTAEVEALESAPQEQVDILDEILDMSIDNQAVANPVETNFVEVSPVEVNLDEVSPGAMNEAAATVEPDLDSILADEQVNLAENDLVDGETVEVSELEELSSQLDEMSLEFGAPITDDVPQADPFDVSLSEIETHRAESVLTTEDMSPLSDMVAEASTASSVSLDAMPSLEGAGSNTAAVSSLTDIVSSTREAAEGLAQPAEPSQLALQTNAVPTDPAQNNLQDNLETSNSNISPTDPQEEASMPVTAISDQAILKDATESASAFASLNKVVEDKAILKERGPRIGDLVQEALRPMLKEWLDENLKDIVERAVNKEVKRISKGN